jgi:hypothetical protein
MMHNRFRDIQNQCTGNLLIDPYPQLGLFAPERQRRNPTHAVAKATDRLKH